MDIQVSLPVFFSDLEKVLRFADSGIVHDHIEFAKFSRYRVNSSLSSLAVAHINRFDTCFPTESFELLTSRLRPFLIEIKNRNVRALTSKTERDRFPDPAACAGY